MEAHGNIIWLDSVKSTNDELRLRAGHLDNLTIVAADRQLSGRGQGDHVWISEPGKNLTFSLLLKFADGLSADSLQKINDFICGTLTELLAGGGIEGVWIKKPNDIWVGERKIAGILIENMLEDNKAKTSIVGVGLNVNQTSWPGELPNPVSMSELTGKTYDRRKLLSCLSDMFIKRFPVSF